MVAEVDIGGPEHGLLEVLEEVRFICKDATNSRMQMIL